MRTKIFALTAILALIFLVEGCALLAPPPYINQTMIIEKDANGNVIASKYERSVIGLSNQDPATVINEWSYADNMARMSINNNYSKNVEEKGFIGVIVNQDLNETFSVEIISVATKKPVSVALMTPNNTTMSWVPAFGEYHDVWKKDGKVVAQGKFTVRNDKIVSYSNYKNLYWYSVKTYP